MELKTHWSSSALILSAIQSIALFDSEIIFFNGELEGDLGKSGCLLWLTVNMVSLSPLSSIAKRSENL